MSLIAHQHKELELIALVEGRADFYMDATCYPLAAGDVLVIPPYRLHRASIGADARYDCICFDLSLLWDEPLRCALEEGTLTVGDRLAAKAPATGELNRCVREAVAACEEAAPGWEMAVIGRLSILFGALRKAGFFVSSGIRPGDSFERAVLDYVSEHYREPITSRAVSGALYRSNEYFCRLFRKSFGCCFSDYLQEYRIEQAKFRLLNEGSPISEIALTTGFHSFSYFSKVFRARVGVSPSEYRRASAAPRV